MAIGPRFKDGTYVMVAGTDNDYSVTERQRPAVLTWISFIRLCNLLFYCVFDGFGLFVCDFLSLGRLCIIACLSLIWISAQAVTGTELQSEVTVWLESGQAIATSQLSGRREIPLGAQEAVISFGSSGINGMVVTSRRLLGFSSRALTWSKKELDMNEKVLEREILPTFSLIRTDRHLYGFRGVNGLWLEEALGVREKVTRFHSNDYGAVFITNERLVGFAPLLGGFASKPLDIHERVVGVDNESGLIVVSTTRRTLVFGSRLSGWEEFE